MLYNIFQNIKMRSFAALYWEPIENGLVDVHNKNVNLLFENAGYVIRGLASRLKHVVRDGNYIKGEEQYQNRVLWVLGNTKY